MRVMGIIVVLTVVAFAFDQKWLGLIIFLFLLGCSLYGVGETVVDIYNGTSTMTKRGREHHLKKHLQSLPPNFNPRYGSLRLRGVSHEDGIRRGEKPTRPDDYFEKFVDREVADYQEAQRTGNWEWFTSPERLRRKQ